MTNYTTEPCITRQMCAGGEANEVLKVGAKSSHARSKRAATTKAEEWPSDVQTSTIVRRMDEAQ